MIDAFAAFAPVIQERRARFAVSYAQQTTSFLGKRGLALFMDPSYAPAKQFWSVIVHDVETAAWFTDLPINKEGVASFTKGLKKNQDGSVDVYFGPKSPKGKETNWLPTVSGKKFFLIFRFYRPTPPLFDKSWKLNDVEKLK